MPRSRSLRDMLRIKFQALLKYACEMRERAPHGNAGMFFRHERDARERNEKTPGEDLPSLIYKFKI